MDATAWVAIAGIAGTLCAALGTEYLRAEHVRKELLLTARIAVYGQFMAATARIVDNAFTLASMPGASLEETAASELDRIVGEVKVVGGKDVRAAFVDFHKHVVALYPKADAARTEQLRMDRMGYGDSANSIYRRLDLNKLAETIKADHSRLEAAIHKELGV